MERRERGKDGKNVLADGARCTSVGRQKQQDKWLKDIFCSCGPWESKKPFFSEIIKNGIGQEVGDGGEGRKEEQ